MKESHTITMNGREAQSIVDSLPKGYMLSKDDVSWIEVVHKVTEDTS
jgi:hypothetical protein